LSHKKSLENKRILLFTDVWVRQEKDRIKEKIKTERKKERVE
jgi:hypothetical protein